MARVDSRIITVILLVATLTLVVGLLASCRSGDAGKKSKPKVLGIASPETYEPTIGSFGGRLVLATMGEPKSFNPIVENESSSREYTMIMWEGLTKSNPWTNEVEPNLAISWESDKSGLVWTVKLREGLTWSDGEPFTADDVVFTFQTIYDKRYICAMRDIITGPHGEEWQLERIDDLTIRFTLFDKNAIFPQLLAEGIIPRHKYKPLVDGGQFESALGTDTPPEEFVGTGPFLLKEYEPGRQVVMMRNPRYWRLDKAGQRLPYLDEIIFLLVPNMDVRLLKFQQGETDILDLRGEDFPVFAKEQAKVDYNLYRLGPYLGRTHLLFNQNTGVNPEMNEPFVEPHKLKWFRDKRFRQAVSYAMDRQGMVNNVFNGLGYPQYGPFNEASKLFFNNPGIRRFEYNLERARELLKAMGMEDRDDDGILEDAEGHKVQFNLTTNLENTQRNAVADIVRKDLETLGMRVNFRPMSFNALISKLDSTFDWEACIIGLTGSTEPHWGANVWRSSGRTHEWFPRQKTPSTDWEAEIDDLFARGIKELDREKRRQIYFRWQEIAAEQQPFIYLVAREITGVIRNKFANIFPTNLVVLREWALIHNLEEIYIKVE